MPKSPNQKIKILYLMQILLEETDDDHALTTAQLIDKLAALDVKAERKTIYDDIETLRHFGLDILNRKDSVIDMVRVATYINTIPAAIEMIEDIIRYMRKFLFPYMNMQRK